ncbi:MAG TPA: hypothetical protein VLG49_06670, partial [Rhabdochlamydiaceae bacterium]|nr:hypothetical protein [Rhabdochlamydiaceae bacterium]
YISSEEEPPIRFFNNRPWTYTNTSNRRINGSHMIVGGFDSGGLSVNFSASHHKDIGAGGSVKVPKTWTLVPS